MNEQKMIDLVNRIADNDKVAPFQNGFVVLTNEEMVRFAKLIVRECLDQLLVSDPKEDFDKGIIWSREQIKDHFGVGE